MATNLGIKIGDPIPLGLRLWDRDENKFVLARLYDPSDSEIAGSPVALNHANGGLYTDDSLPMPNVSYLRINYDVYDDAGFVNLSQDHLPAVEQVFVDRVSQDVSDILAEVVMPDLKAIIKEPISLYAKQLPDDQPLMAQIVDTVEQTDIVEVMQGARSLIVDANNGTGAVQSEFKAWAWRTSDSRAVLADANESLTLDDFIGVNAETVAIDANFEIIAQGTVEGALVGLGAEPGQLIYLGEVPGSFSLTPPAIGSGTNLIVGRAYPNAVGAAEAINLFIDPQLMG